MTGENLPDRLPKPTAEEIVYWVPSHLTRSLVAGGLAVVCGAYAAYEFRKITAEEVQAFLHP